MKSKTAFLYGPRDLRIEEVDVPKLKPDQVLVQTGACGICGSDVECYEGGSAEGRYDIGPYTPGHEWGGRIAEVGSDVATLKPGMKVTGDCVMACGVCDNCKNGLMPSACLSMREAGFRPDSPGGMGEYMVIEEKYVHRIPDEWTYEQGAWVETFSVGYFGIWGNGGYIDASDTAIILGAGPIGLSVLITAAVSGATIIVVDPFENRRKRLIGKYNLRNYRYGYSLFRHYLPRFPGNECRRTGPRDCIFFCPRHARECRSRAGSGRTVVKLRIHTSCRQDCPDHVHAGWTP